MPKSTWSKDGKPLKGVETDQTPEFCKIKLKAVKRPDGGEYELELMNDSGVDKVPITLKVIGKSSKLYLTKVAIEYSVTIKIISITNKITHR